MRTISSLFRLKIGPGDIDTFVLQLAQTVCFMLSGFVLLVSWHKLGGLDLAEVAPWTSVQQGVQTALLFGILGLLLSPKSKAA